VRCAGVAKAFTTIFAPCARPGGNVFGAQFLLSQFRRPAEFTARTAAELAFQQYFPTHTPRISQLPPNEMTKLMDEDPPQFARAPNQLPIQDDAALP
jgi:hypothetical protein